MHSNELGQGRALVPIAPASTGSGRAGRADASFLVHLIATRRELPQTRARRRAEPQEAARVYRAAATQAAPRPMLSRSF